MKKLILITIFGGWCVFPVFAQHVDSETAKDANNPLASIKAVSVHNIYTPSLCGMDGTMNTLWVRYAQPIGRVLMRASMPVNTVDVPTSVHSGLGDFNIFGTYLLSKPTSHKQFGVGPILTIPTATSKVLGSGKWQLGAAFVGYFDANPIFQLGFLLTWQHSFAGSSHRHNAHAASFQPFLMWQLGKGLYMRSTAITIFDFANKKYMVPVGLGMGKVIILGKAVCNLFVEPQFSAWNKGTGLSKTQLFVGVNTQF